MSYESLVKEANEQMNDTFERQRRIFELELREKETTLRTELWQQYDKMSEECKARYQERLDTATKRADCMEKKVELLQRQLMDRDCAFQALESKCKELEKERLDTATKRADCMEKKVELLQRQLMDRDRAFQALESKCKELEKENAELKAAPPAAKNRKSSVESLDVVKQQEGNVQNGQPQMPKHQDPQLIKPAPNMGQQPVKIVRRSAETAIGKKPQPKQQAKIIPFQKGLKTGDISTPVAMGKRQLSKESLDRTKQQEEIVPKSQPQTPKQHDQQQQKQQLVFNLTPILCQPQIKIIPVQVGLQSCISSLPVPLQQNRVKKSVNITSQTATTGKEEPSASTFKNDVDSVRLATGQTIPMSEYRVLQQRYHLRKLFTPQPDQKYSE